MNRGISSLDCHAPCGRLQHSSANLRLSHSRERPKQGEEHMHDEIQIAIPISGAVTAEWETATGGRKRQPLPINSLFLRDSQQPHAIRILQEAEILTLWLPAHALAGALPEGTGGDKIEIADPAPAQDPLLQQLCFALVAEVRHDALPSHLYLDSMATAMAVHLVRHYSTSRNAVPARTDGLPPRTLRRVTDYIQDNLGTNLTLKSLADIAGLSGSRFCLLFHQSTGMSPYQFVIAQRIAEAKRLLRTRKISAGEVAQQVGFCDQSQFTRQFKRQMGLTPSAFARSVQD